MLDEKTKQRIAFEQRHLPRFWLDSLSVKVDGRIQAHGQVNGDDRYNENERITITVLEIDTVRGHVIGQYGKYVLKNGIKGQGGFGQ